MSARKGRIEIAIPDPTPEDRAHDMWQAHGLKRARQEDWERIAGLIRVADAERKLTPGGMSVAELIAYGARADVMGAVEHAVARDTQSANTLMRAGIEALETVVSEMPQDATIAAVVARAHLDIASAWRGKGRADAMNDSAQEAFNAHIERARDLLAPFGADHHNTPLFLSTHCALLRGSAAQADDIANAFEQLIDMNPQDSRQMRALGTALLPRWHGGYDRLDREARRTAARLSAIWGAGGYTWVMFDAIIADQTACAALDVGYFLDGLRDILARRQDQFTVNLLASFAAVTMRHAANAGTSGTVRNALHEAHAWIIREHMTELHPLLWTHASYGFDTALRVREIETFAPTGIAQARRVLNQLFLPELTRGDRVVFTANGAIVQTA